MGYITVDVNSNIISVTDIKTPTIPQITINNEELIAQIKADMAAYKWIDSEVVYIPPPSKYHSWNGTEWIFDEYLKESAQHYMWGKIMEFRDNKYSQGCKVIDYWFHTDVDSKLKYLGLLAFGSNLPENLQWKTMTGEMVTMTVELLQNVFIAVTTQEATVFAMGEYHKGNLMLSEDPLNYDYSQGWVATYSE